MSDGRVWIEDSRAAERWTSDGTGRMTRLARYMWLRHDTERSFCIVSIARSFESACQNQCRHVGARLSHSGSVFVRRLSPIWP